MSYISDLGGLDRCSEIKLGLLRRLAAATVQAELLEARLMNGEQVDVTTLCTLASTTLRIAWRLGLERVPRDMGVNSQLGEYLTRRYGKGKYPRGVSKEIRDQLFEPRLVEESEPPEPPEPEAP
jgi:hypothetical protein